MTDFAKLRELDKAATSEKWKIHRHEGRITQIYAKGSVLAVEPEHEWCSAELELSEEDAALIVAMRNALPALLDRIEELEVAVGTLQEMADEAANGDPVSLLRLQAATHLLTQELAEGGNLDD